MQVLHCTMHRLQQEAVFLQTGFLKCGEINNTQPDTDTLLWGRQQTTVKQKRGQRCKQSFCQSPHAPIINLCEHLCFGLCIFLIFTGPLRRCVWEKWKARRKRPLLYVCLALGKGWICRCNMCECTPVFGDALQSTFGTCQNMSYVVNATPEEVYLGVRMSLRGLMLSCDHHSCHPSKGGRWREEGKSRVLQRGHSRKILIERSEECWPASLQK